MRKEEQRRLQHQGLNQHGKKLNKFSNVVCRKSISLKVRGTLYKSYVRNALTYGAECWALKVEDERKLKTTEMRML